MALVMLGLLLPTLRMSVPRAAGGLSCVGIVAPLTFLVAVRWAVALARAGRANLPPLALPNRGLHVSKRKRNNGLQ